MLFISVFVILLFFYLVLSVYQKYIAVKPIFIENQERKKRAKKEKILFKKKARELRKQRLKDDLEKELEQDD